MQAMVSLVCSRSSFGRLDAQFHQVVAKADPGFALEQQAEIGGVQIGHPGDAFQSKAVPIVGSKILPGDADGAAVIFPALLFKAKEQRAKTFRQQFGKLRPMKYILKVRLQQFPFLFDQAFCPCVLTDCLQYEAGN